MKENSTKKLFQEVLSKEAKLNTLSLLADEGQLLKVRTNLGIEITVKAIRWTSPARLEVESQTPSVQWGNKPLTVQFDGGSEKYFSRVTVSPDKGKLYFIFSGPLYRLHRRQHERLNIPSSYKNHVVLMNVNEQVLNEECLAVDISLGGCSLMLSYRSLDISVGAVVMLNMQIGKQHPAFPQIGKICYKRLEKFEGKSKVKIGVQFYPHPKYSLYLRSVVQDLSLELFMNWSQRKSK